MLVGREGLTVARSDSRDQSEQTDLNSVSSQEETGLRKGRGTPSEPQGEAIRMGGWKVGKFMPTASLQGLTGALAGTCW